MNRNLLALAQITSRGERVFRAMSVFDCLSKRAERVFAEGSDNEFLVGIYMVVRKKKRVSSEELVAYFALAWTLLSLIH